MTFLIKSVALIFLYCLVLYLVTDVSANTFEQYPGGNKVSIYSSENIQEWVYPTFYAWDIPLLLRLVQFRLMGLGKSELDRLHTVSLFVWRQLDPLRGTPSMDDFSSPLSMWNAIHDKQIEVYCTHFTYSLALFNSQVGLPARAIHLRTPQNTKILMHTVAEVYLPSKQRWVMVDLTHNAFVVFDENDIPLNTQQVLDAYINNRKIYFLGPDGMVKVDSPDWISIYESQQKYFSSGTKLIFEKPGLDFGTVYIQS